MAACAVRLVHEPQNFYTMLEMLVAGGILREVDMPVMIPKKQSHRSARRRNDILSNGI